MRALRLPEHLRKTLSESKGELIVGEDLAETARKTLEKTKECIKTVAVGDVVCSTIIEAGKTPDLCVIDGRSRRTPIKGLRYGVKELRKKYVKIIEVRNPASHITQEALNAIRNSLKAVSEGTNTLIIVDGEEDLLTLPLTAEAPENTCVLYGIPNKGISVIKVNEGIKEEAKKILKEFHEVSLLP